ncbi:MarR family winged helix-turn-helix transcriptional regulator [Ureibacillus chungkukjangi]|uniref:MarR family winged helix-turn-helix transcriptional regulator n=1 Tax=Ureibacillus chungkukjangi TaxID=1202712 RepID=UPI000D379D45|nr:MarR family transcriptional regulator [Ureibacillus chungkukjangi]MCM3387522.1 MarR family transcriptional regulator [Ureibacillus chungkukjangi]
MINVEQFDLFDLISERHGTIRRILEEKWNEMSDISISNSEWYIMSKVNNHQPTISMIAKNVQISRQAAHKVIKKLEAKGLVELVPGSNNRDKCIQLTDLGQICIDKYIVLKKDIEKKISENVEIQQLKAILKSDWGI